MIIPDKRILVVRGRAVPKPVNGQNTDDIIPARYLKEITFERMGDYVYFDERFKNGVPVESHPFNDPKYGRPNILVAGANYGCGSSREHAPQALKRFGINAIVAGSFAEIFAGNCASIGIVGVTLPEKDIAEIVGFLQENPGEYLEINMVEKSVSCWKKFSKAFDIPEGRRQAFLDGTWDAMTVLQHNEKGIREKETRLEYLHW